MGPQITAPAGPTLALQVIFLLLFMFPDFSLMLWKAIMKKWTLSRAKVLIKRSKKTEEKYKKYWEIDIRKFK
jgi:hypothetical protein